jgi:hypothetical protein
VQPVAVRILLPKPGASLGPLERALHDAHDRNARRLAAAFRAQGVTNVLIITDRRNGRSLGEKLRGIAAASDVSDEGLGLIVAGGGSLPLATPGDLRPFIDVAGSGERRALANNRYSVDAIAIGRPAALAELPDLRADNPLARWLDEIAGFEVDDLRRRWRLAVDLDSPLDVLLVGGELSDAVDTSAVLDRLDRIRGVSTDRRAELLVAGRTSATTLRWLERATASRTRALVEERGMKAAAPFAAAARNRSTPPRPPKSSLGLILDDRGPETLGDVLAQLGDAALVDSRVLLAHRLGADERDWPSAADRFASDLLLPDRIADPWLRALTLSARDAAIPIVLGGHSLVGPGIRLALRTHR